MGDGLHPRRAAAELGQTYEPEVPVEVREWIAPALASPDLVLEPLRGTGGLSREARRISAKGSKPLVRSASRDFAEMMPGEAIRSR